MKAIITVVGKDKSGIVAGVATKVAELGLNIGGCIIGRQTRFYTPTC